MMLFLLFCINVVFFALVLLLFSYLCYVRVVVLFIGSSHFFSIVCCVSHISLVFLM